MTTFDNAITRRQVAYPRYAKYLDRFAPLTVASVALAFVAILSMVAFVASVFGGNLVSMALSLVTTVVTRCPADTSAYPPASTDNASYPMRHRRIMHA